jgi:UDP-N-acetylglucosamine 2-epimerase
MYKILTIVGARPHFIKAAMVSKAIAANASLKEVIVHTGQHYDHNLSGAFFEELQLPQPAYHLGIGSGRAGWQTGQAIIALDEVIQQEAPDLVIVYGDTNSTAAGAITAAKNNLPLAHIEAGLREFNKQIPEEVNKLLTDAVTDLFFCPTPTGVKNLKQNGIVENVHLVGDVGIDLIFEKRPLIKENKGILERYGLRPQMYYLLTCHRAANTNQKNPLEQILRACIQLPAPVVFPIHPRTAKAIEAFELNDLLVNSNLILLPPLGFLDLQSLLYHARMTITDSGGIIKEAYFHKVPAVIIDRQTEWIETVEEGWNVIAGPDAEKILEAVHQQTKPSTHSNCLGDGTAARKTVEIIARFLHQNFPSK